MNSILNQLLTSFQRSLVLIGVESCGLREKLLEGIDSPLTPTSTADRLVLAASALGMVEGNPVKWSEPYLSLANHGDEWQRTIAVIEHQKTYLHLAKEVGENSDKCFLPAQQLTSSPGEYFSFLKGVDASHWNHAEWLANLPEFQESTHLIDIGGGLGTFSKAWVRAKQHRLATVVDLQGVESLPSMPEALDARLRFLGADLLQRPSLPPGDIYLLANVLHLLPGWPEALRHVVEQAPISSFIVIMEANPGGPAGRLFDLQVHLRSGGITGLLRPVDVESELVSLGLSEAHVLETFDESDPFQREYQLWIARKTSPASRCNAEV